MKSGTLHRVFLVTVAAILLVTAAAKTVALLPRGDASREAMPQGVLTLPAPYIPRWTNGDMMWVAVAFELAVLLALVRLRTDAARLVLVAFVGGVFAAYHIGLGVIGYRHPCGCLGGPLDWLHLSRRAYDALTLGIIVYLLAGSYGLLGWDAIASRRRLLAPAGRALRPPAPAN
jgi:hypothetical protein